MKKVFIVLLVLLLVTGCQKSEEGGIGGCSIDEEVECAD